MYLLVSSQTENTTCFVAQVCVCVLAEGLHVEHVVRAVAQLTVDPAAVYLSLQVCTSTTTRNDTHFLEAETPPAAATVTRAHGLAVLLLILML